MEGGRYGGYDERRYDGRRASSRERRGYREGGGRGDRRRSRSRSRSWGRDGHGSKRQRSDDDRVGGVFMRTGGLRRLLGYSVGLPRGYG